MSEWKEFKLKELTCKIGSGATPRGGSNNYKLNGISLIRSQNVHDLKFSYDGLAFIDETQADDLHNVIVKKNDLLLNITGDSVARVCKVPINVLPARVNQHVSIIRSDDNFSHPDFLLYNLYHIKEYLLSISEIGGTRRAITKLMLEELNIRLPSIPEQTAIATILSSLDDKIDLLHRQNKTLEQMAETLFRQWFIEEAEEGWEEKSLRAIADHFKEGINPSGFPEKVFHHFSIPAYDEGKSPKVEIGKEILSNKFKVIPNSILISKLNPRFPRIWELYGTEIPDNSICSTEFQIVKPKNISYFGFIFCFLKSNQVFQKLTNAVSGTSGSHQRVSPEDIFNLIFLYPPKERIEEFDSITKEYFLKIKSNANQIKTLTQLRDTLLPKLMSGEVTIDN